MGLHMLSNLIKNLGKTLHKYHHVTKQFLPCFNWLITCFRFQNMFWKNISCFWFTGVFPWILREFLRLSISKNISERLLFDFFNSSLFHGPEVSRSRLNDGVRLQAPSHRSSFLFLSRHLLSLTESRPVLENLRRKLLVSQ